MKVLLLELSGGESCASQPSRYSGAGPTFRDLAENIPEVYLAAQKSCFESDVTEKCIVLNENDIKAIKSGEDELFDNYDLYVYTNPDIVLDTNVPQIVWAVGAYEKVHPDVKHLLLHNSQWQCPNIQNLATKIYEFVLGVKTTPFEYIKKEDFIFQCSNHYSQINSVLLANWCRKYGILGIFAGPIDPNYKKEFLDQIDYKNTFYISQIDEEEKIKLLRKAKIYGSLYSHQINGPPKGVKLALNYGCGILTTTAGIMPEVIKNNLNGFIINTEQDFVKAWNNKDLADQYECWKTAQNWSIEKMVESFKQVIAKVLNDR